MQGTVGEFHPQTGAGTVLLDDGSVVPFGPAAFARSGLRGLRPGQRVRLELAAPAAGPARQVDRLTLATLPFP